MKKRIAIIVLGIFLFLILFLTLNINFISSKSLTTSDTITSTIGEDAQKSAFDLIKKVHQISDSVIANGYTGKISEYDCFKVTILEKDYSFIFFNFTSDTVNVVITGGKYGTLEINQTKVVDVNSDSKNDVELTLNSLAEGIAEATIRNYYEKEDISGGYKELFDVDMELKEDKVKDSKDLAVFMKFINFGEGPSKINITYTISYFNNTELYKGVDEKVVYTEESITKSFDFLELKPGRYKLYLIISYGKNQTAESEKIFEVLESKYSNNTLIIISVLLIFLLIIIAISFFRKNIQEKISPEANDGSSYLKNKG
jgi:hypothetical protein